MASKINRRAFLRRSAAVGMAGLAGRHAFAQQPAAGASKPPRRGANEEIRTAIIGIRAQGKLHIKYHQASKNMRIVTLCDPDTNLFADRVKLVKGGTPKTETDMRRVFDDKDVDCVSIATPNYWHALATVWACQAGKDVYVEKPATYCIAEGRKMMAAAEKYGRVVQVGTHLRANKGRQEAMAHLRDGLIGDVYMARTFVFRARESIGHKADAPVPAGVDYDLWCGPAPKHPFNPNRFHYEWHWFWDTGNGEIGNNGPHVMDMAIEGLNKQETLPTQIVSQGKRVAWDDQAETPNTHIAQYQYADGTLLTIDVRNLPSPHEIGTSSGVLFLGSKGYLSLQLNGTHETLVDGKPGPKGSGKGAHPELVANFYDVVRSRNVSDLLAPVAYGHTGAALCHLGNIAYRVGRAVNFDPKSETFGNDREANAHLTRTYRAPYTMPDIA